MTTPSATFEFSTDNGATWKASDLPLAGANALAASGSPIVIKARLSSLAGVGPVEWKVVTGDDQTIEAGALPQPVVASDKSCTLTIPGTGGRSYVLEALVNGGRLNSRAQNEAPGLRRRLAIHVKTTNGFEVVAAAEADEANRTYGWIKAPNDVARGAGGGGGGAGVSSLKVFGQADITGAAVLKQGANVTLSQSGQEITIAAASGLALGGAPPAIASASAAGATGQAADAGHTHAGASSVKVFSQAAITGDVVFKPGTGVALSQLAQEITVANSAPAPVPGGTGDRDKVVAANATGSALGLVATLWPTALRVNAVGGSIANDTFCLAPVQSTGDTTNGEAFAARATGGGRGAYGLYSSANAAMGLLAYDEAADRVALRGNSKSVVVATDAAETKVALRVEGNSFNVGVCGASAYGTSGDGVFAIGLAAVAPGTNPANTMILYNSGGNGHVSCTGSMALAVGNVVKARVTSAEAALVGLISLGQTGGSFGGATGTAVYVKNATAAAGTNPSGGHVYYAAPTTSEPLWRTSGGAVRSAVTVGSASLSGLFVATANGGTTNRELKKRPIVCSDGSAVEWLTAEA
jgi:hypothetical protein